MYPFQKIQNYLIEHHIDALFIPKHDRFFLEYVKPCDDFLQYVTGFSGSAGFCLITKHKIFLWVDGRYTLQAKQEILSPEIHILNHPSISFKSIIVGEKIKSLAFDADKISIYQYNNWKKIFHDNLIALKEDFTNRFWPERPCDELTPYVYVYPLEYAGVCYFEKIALIKKTITQPFLVTQPDELCWLFNIRGNAVDYSPLVHGYALISPTQKPILFLPDGVDRKKLIDYFKGHVDIFSFHELLETLKRTSIVFADFTTTPVVFAQLHHVSINDFKSPIQDLKAIKNKTEQENMAKAHVHDAVSVMETLCWLDNHQNKESLTELDVVDYLEKKRAIHPHFKSLSFCTIAGSGSNGAIIHYRVNQETNKNLGPNNKLLLLDSGGQYFEGTTDITRTIALTSDVSKGIKKRYTQVLKGSIAVSNCVFPKNTSGKQLDILARQYLWRDGENFSHGTGHGVGCFLNVHEGPQAISPGNDCPLKSGMIVSNEPGYYLEGAYGIRLENLELIENFHKEGFLNFKTLTLVPYDERCIDFGLLENAEKQWLDAYYKRIKNEVFGHLSPDCQDWFTKKQTEIVKRCHIKSHIKSFKTIL